MSELEQLRNQFRGAIGQGARSDKELAIFSLLSRLGDHFDKNSYWLKGQFRLYSARFEKIPTDFLTKAFKDYLVYDHPRYLPTLSHVWDYVREHQGFRVYWLQDRSGGEFCIHCRSDEHGNYGGFRSIFCYREGENGRMLEEDYRAKCDCPGGMMQKGQNFHSVEDWLRRKFPRASITHDFYSADQDRIVTAKEQSELMMVNRVRAGYFAQDEFGNYEPDFSHDFWLGTVGLLLAENLDIEIPEDVILRGRKKRRGMLAEQNYKARKRLQNAIANDDYTGGTLRSIGDLI